MFEVGEIYAYLGDTPTPTFEAHKDYSLNYANAGFVMKKGDMSIQYDAALYTLRRSGTYASEAYRCVCLAPLTFEVDNITCKLFEGSVASLHHETVRGLLRMLGHASISDLDVQVITEAVVPESDKNADVTESEMLSNLIEYLNVHLDAAYAGNKEKTAPHYKELIDVLTVLFGRCVAYAAMQLIPTNEVTIRYNGRLMIFYGDTEIINTLIAVRRDLDGKED